jgi:hypothetical protein
MVNHPHFGDLLDEVRRLRPPVPRFEAQSDNTEIWKQKSSEQRGFDLFASILNLKIEETNYD